MPIVDDLNGRTAADFVPGAVPKKGAKAGPTSSEPPTEPPSLLRQIAANAVGIGAPIVGGMVAGPVGLAAGGAAGEIGREKILNEPTSLPDIALNTVLPLIPGGIAGRFVKGPVSGAVARMAEGGTIGAGYSATRSLLRGETPDPKEVLMGAATGSVLGGVAGGLEGRFAPHVEAKPVPREVQAIRKQIPDEEIQNIRSRLLDAQRSGDTDRLASIRAEIATKRAGVRQALELKPQAQGQQPKPLTRNEARRVAPAIHRQASVKNLIDGALHSETGPLGFLRRAVAPYTLAQPSDVNILTSARGSRAMKLMWSAKELEPVHQVFEKTPALGLQFISNLEHNRPQAHPDPTISRALTQADKLMREQSEGMFQTIQRYRDLPHRENYFPHLWENQSQAEQFFHSRRPMEGSKRFFKKRWYEDIDEGIKHGLKPISTNPVVMQLAYLHDASKFIMAQEAFNGFRDAGRLMWVPHGKVAPRGWTNIDDAVARRYFPPNTAKVVVNGKTTQRLVEAGQYAADSNVARLIHNALSMDHIKAEPTLRGAIWANHRLNGIQLGLSAWHAMFVGLDSSASEAALGLERGMSSAAKLKRGEVGGAATDLVRSFKHSLTAASLFGAPVKYGREGAQFLGGRFVGPSRGRGSQLERWLAQGGADLNVRGQYFLPGGWGSWEHFRANVRGRKLSSVVEFPFAAIDKSMRPLFEYAIPRIKIGAFASLMRNELERNWERIARGEISEATLARQNWAHIENRLGELNYDNLFWNNTFKTATQATIRAVGFNVGTVRELGGGIFSDLPRYGRALDRGDVPDLTPKLQYLLGLGMTVAGFGGLFHKLHTGKSPESVEDFFYPKNGEKDDNGNEVRVMLPTYLKDVDVFKHPTTKVYHKFSPLATTFIELLTNRDFKNDMIYNEGAGLDTRAKQILTHLATQVEPFSFQQMSRVGGEKGFIEAMKKAPVQTSEALIGVTHAPRDMIVNPPLDAARQVAQAKSPGRGPRTPEQVASDNEKHGQQATLQKAMGFQLRPEDRTMRRLNEGERAKLRAQYPELATHPNADPITQELVRVGAQLPQAARTHQLGKKTYALPPDMAERLATSRGELIRQMLVPLLKMPTYQSAPPTTQRTILEKTIERANKIAWGRMRPELAKLLKDEITSKPANTLNSQGAP